MEPYLFRVFYSLGTLPGTQIKRVETDGIGGAVAWQRPVSQWQSACPQLLGSHVRPGPTAGAPRGSRSPRGRPVPSLSKLSTVMRE